MQISLSIGVILEGFLLNILSMLKLAHREKKVCSKGNLPKELQLTKKSASWTDYPKNIVNAIIKPAVKRYINK